MQHIKKVEKNHLIILVWKTYEYPVGNTPEGVNCLEDCNFNNYVNYKNYYQEVMVILKLVLQKKE